MPSPKDLSDPITSIFSELLKLLGDPSTWELLSFGTT